MSETWITAGEKVQQLQAKLAACESRLARYKAVAEAARQVVQGSGWPSIVYKRIDEELRPALAALDETSPQPPAHGGPGVYSDPQPSTLARYKAVAEAARNGHGFKKEECELCVALAALDEDSEEGGT